MGEAGISARRVATPKVRPTFEMMATIPPPEVILRVKASDRHEGPEPGPVVVLFADASTIELVPHSSQVHLWSPQLRLDLEASDGGTQIHARFAPHPHVWSLYLAIHAIGALGTIGAAVFGYSQYLAGQTPWALWALAFGPLLAALVWALAFVGQSLGAEQMYALRRFVEDALDGGSAS